MFNWFRRQPPPLPGPAANPGLGTTAKVGFARGDRSWTEEVDTVDTLTRALTGLEHLVTCDETHVRLLDSGLVLRPQFVALQPLDRGGVRTVTTIEASHPGLSPGGVFEFQHATGDDAEASIRSGFEQWAQTDLVTFLEALRDKPEACMMLQMTFPGRAGAPGLTRRAILGPVAHMTQKPPSSQGKGQGKDKDDEHPFCSCCLLTRSFEAFKNLLQDDGFYAIRLFAARDETGKPQADCRVNGADWEPGAAALRKYARTWPDAGFEFRKQYVILQTVPHPGPDADDDTETDTDTDQGGEPD